MKITVSATEGSLNADIDMRFGRCPYYIIFEIEENKIKGHEILKNIADQEMRGAGITAAQIVVNKETNIVITGNVGPKSFSVLSASGIKIISGVNGNVKDAVEKYLRGELKESKKSMPGFGMGRGKGWNQQR